MGKPARPKLVVRKHSGPHGTHEKQLAPLLISVDASIWLRSSFSNRLCAALVHSNVVNDFPPSRRSRLWVWRRQGRGPGRNRGSAVYTRMEPPRWWSIPARIWRVLKRRQGIRPAPILYLVVAAAGVLIGGILQLTLGIWWWLPPLILLAATWLFFLSSAWWHRPGSHPISLRTELLQVWNPEKGLRARNQEEMHRIRVSGLPMFEIVDWPGTKRLGGWGGDGTRVSHVTLAFAERPESPGLVSVRTTVDDGSGVDRMRANLAGELRGILIQKETVDPTDPATIHEAHLRVVERIHALPWTPAAVRLDGETREGWQLRADNHTIAYTLVDGFWVSITAPHDQTIALRTVTAPADYLHPDLPL